MKQFEIRRQQVWGKTLRWCHWGMAISVLVLIFTGGLIAWVPEKAEVLDDSHFVAAAVLIAVIAIRFWLLFFGKGSDLLKNFWPNRHQLNQGWEVLRAYLTLGKIPLPKWYAHNPLWAPLYLFLFVLLMLQIVSGLLLLNQITLLGDVSIRQLHVLGFQIITVFTLLHILASFFHDAKGTGSDLSAMVNGHRIFIIEPQQPEKQEISAVVSLDSLRKSISRTGTPKKP